MPALEKPRLQLSPNRLLYLTLPRLWGGGWGVRKDSTHPWEPWRHSGGICLCAATLPLFKATLLTSQSGCRGEGLAGMLWLMVPSGQETKDGGGKQGLWQSQPGRQGFSFDVCLWAALFHAAAAAAIMALSSLPIFHVR